MSFISLKSLLTIILISLLSLSLAAAQSIQGEAVRKQLATISPIQIDLEGVTIEEAIERLKSVVMAKGMPNFNVIYDLESQEGFATKTANLYLENINADFAFEQIIQAFGALAIYDNYAIRLIPTQGNNLSFISKKWQIPPDFFKDLAAKTSGDPNALNTVAPQKPLDILRQLGVPLPEGSSGIHVPSSNFLEVRAPAQSIEIIDQFIADAKQKEASQVSLRIKLVTINQDDLDQLGFDWTTGGLTSITGGAAVSSTVNSNLLDTTTNLTSTPTQSLTAGNRTITELSEFTSDLDSMLNDITRIENGSAAAGKRAPGVLSYINNFDSSEQAAVMLRALSQSKSFDVMESPHVVVKSGQKGTFFKGSELKYPTAYEQSEISESGGTSTTTVTTDAFGNVTVAANNVIPSTFSITPAHPTDFEAQKLGVELSVEPTLSANNQLINLSINPQFYDFSGFISYGERILNIAYYSETYLDNDGDGIVLVGVNGDGNKVVIEDVLGGLVNSLIINTNVGFALVNGINIPFNVITGFTNNITVSNNPGLNQTLTVTNSRGGTDTYTSTLVYTNTFVTPLFYFTGGYNQGSTVFVITDDIQFSVLNDLSSTDTYAYELRGLGDWNNTSPGSTAMSTLFGTGFIHFVDPAISHIYEATPNIVVQPIFNKIELNTQATIKSGETVLIGGVMQQNKIALDDSLPLLGDIPLVGQLFDSKGDDTESKAVLIFIEAVAQDPMGNPVSE